MGPMATSRSSNIPLGRKGRPEEISHAVLYLQPCRALRHRPDAGGRRRLDARVMGAADDTWADEKAIIDLTVAYAWALDTAVRRPPSGVRRGRRRDLAGQHCEGLDAITARIERPLSRLDVTQHVVTNHQVKVDGDTATCRCYLVGQHVKGTDGGDTFIMAGVYDDELRRTADGWRIVHRTLTVTWTDGNPAVIGR